MNKFYPVFTALRIRFACTVLSLFLAVTWHVAMAASPSVQFTLGGYLNSAVPISFNLVSLQTFVAFNPSAQQTVSVTNSSGGTDVYTGISLSSFLNAYIKTDPTVPKNDILRDYVVATGTDGYRAVFSLGEINSSFGNQNDIIAYQLNGQPLTTNGFARIVAPGDVAAGRWVSNLASLEVGHVPYTVGPGGFSPQFSIGGQVSKPLTYNATVTTGLPVSTVTVNTPPLAGTTYTGVSLWSLLNLAVIITDPTVKNDILGKFVIATGSDGYQSVFSLGELSPNFGNQANLVAYANSPGNPLTTDGFARIVVPGDLAKAGRYVSNLVSLQIVSAPTLTQVECLFNWAEKNYPKLFTPAGFPTAISTAYTYRNYSSTNAFLGVSPANNHVYFIGADGKSQDEGQLSNWLTMAGCQ